ncbi:MAG TPA: hypothetical protein VF549_15065 [Solirubrobacteraceae bacterium]|jgi:hypothetical protein
MAPIAGPIAMAATAAQTFKDVSQGNLGAAGLDLLSLGAGGASMALARHANTARRAYDASRTNALFRQMSKDEYTKLSRWMRIAPITSLVTGQNMFPLANAWGYPFR